MENNTDEKGVAGDDQSGFVVIPEKEIERYRVFTEAELIARIKDAIDKSPSAKSFADEHSLSAEYTRQVVRGIRRPGAQMLRALGFERVTFYRVANGTVTPGQSSFDDSE